MKKTVSFKKDIPFKSNLAEIISISLDHELKLEERVVKGNLIVSGSYKMNDVSINTEEFNYNIPVNIEMGDKYILDNLNIDIENFYYEIIDNKILSADIEVALNNLEEKEKKEVEEILQPVKFETTDILEELKKENRNVENEEVKEEIIEEVKESRDITNNVKSLFDSFDDSNEAYATYQIYIIKEGDTLESILIKYGIYKEMLDLYNDTTEIKIGDKLIIPSLLNEKD